MKNKITTKDIMRKTRGKWTINPVTRVHDNKKSIKKDRQEAKKALRDYIE